MTGSFTIDRKMASDLMGVSLRTLDRYIRKGRLRARRINGFVKLDENEVKAFNTGYVPRDDEEVVEQANATRIHRSLDGFDTIDVQSEVGRILGEDIVSEDRSPNVYEILYKDTKDELKEYQQKLEIANYRVGQLEAQVQNSIPLLEHKAASQRAEAKAEKIKEIAKKYLRSAKSLEKQLQLEKVNAKVYVVLLFIILGLQPILWWLLQK